MSDDFAAVVRSTPRAELPALIGRLAAAQAEAVALLAAPLNASAAPTEPDRLLTPDQAAEIAGVRVARVYRWARGARWAVRPSRRCLRVSERGFRSWLATGTRA